MGVTLGVTLGTNLCAGTPPAAAALPSEIITGGARKAWFRADQGITLNGANVSGWSNIWGNGDLSQGTAAAQLRYDATAVGGRPAVTNPSTGNRGLTGTLTSGLTTAARHYAWCMLLPTQAPPGDRYWASAGRTANSAVITAMKSTSGGVWYALLRGGSLVQGASAVAVAVGEPVLVEVGNTASGTASLVVAGTGVNFADAGAFASTETGLTLFGADGVIASSPVGSLAEYILMEGEPTAQQRTDMRAYFASRYGEL